MLEESKKANQTHCVMNQKGDVMYRGTKDSCSYYLVANAPLCAILGDKLFIRKIKAA